MAALRLGGDGSELTAVWEGRGVARGPHVAGKGREFGSASTSLSSASKAVIPAERRRCRRRMQHFLFFCAAA